MFEDSPIKKILFDTLVEMGRLPSNPSESTIQTINDISDSEALKLLRSLPGTGPTIQKAGGGMMNIDEMIRPIGMAAGGPIPPEPEKTGMMKKIKDLFKYENESGTGSLLMDFIRSEGMFAPSGKKFDTSDSPMFKSGIFSKAAEASTLVDFLKSKRARLMSDIQGEMQGNIFGTGVDEGKIKILQIEIDKLTEQLNDLGEN